METKEKIIEELEGVKEYEILFKFADVYWEIKAKSKAEAEEKADKLLEKVKNNPKEETYCYEIEVDE